jgi:hypothetical protein
MSCTIQDGEILVSHDGGSFAITPIKLKEANANAY